MALVSLLQYWNTIEQILENLTEKCLWLRNLYSGLDFCIYIFSGLEFYTQSYSLEKTLMLATVEGKRRRGWQRIRCLDSITNSVDMNLGKLREIVRDRKASSAAVHGVAKSLTQLSD